MGKNIYRHKVNGIDLELLKFIKHKFSEKISLQNTIDYVSKNKVKRTLYIIFTNEEI